MPLVTGAATWLLGCRATALGWVRSSMHRPLYDALAAAYHWWAEGAQRRAARCAAQLLRLKP
jgi:hypothetical protein